MISEKRIIKKGSKNMQAKIFLTKGNEENEEERSAFALSRFPTGFCFLPLGAGELHLTGIR